MATASGNSVTAPTLDSNNGTLSDEFINGLLQGGQWTFGGGAHVVTYQFNVDGPSVGGTTIFWTPTFSNAFVAATQAWSNVANITFQDVGNPNGPLFTNSAANIAV